MIKRIDNYGVLHATAGQIASVASVAGTTAYSLDIADRLALIDAPSATFDYAYNTLVESGSILKMKVKVNSRIRVNPQDES